jgi:hypothetical protein
MREDARLQPDPELQMSGGHRAGPWQIAFTFLAGFLVVFGVLYGINHQRDEGDRNAAGGGGSVTAQAPAQNVAGGEAGDQQAQREGRGGEPAGTPQTTGSGGAEKSGAGASDETQKAQPEQAKPATGGSQR